MDGDTNITWSAGEATKTSLDNTYDVTAVAQRTTPGDGERTFDVYCTVVALDTPKVATIDYKPS